MNAETFCEHFATFADAPNGIAKLRELILQLAVQGKLVSQDAIDEPGNLLRLRIIAKRQQLIDSGEFTAFATDTEWPDGALPHTLPNGWEWIRLGELGGFLGGGTPSKERAEFWNGKIPWVSPKDMKRPYMDDAIDHVTPLGVENSSGKMIPKSSLLMVVCGMILAHSFPVALAMRELTINQDMKALQLALPELGEYLLRCCTACKSQMLESVERSSHGTCRLPTEAVANFPIPLPPLAEQRRIVEKVDQLLGLCDELAARQAAQREKRQRLVGATLDRLVSCRRMGKNVREGEAPAEPQSTRIQGQTARQEPRPPGMQSDFEIHAHRLRNHFDQLFDTPTTIPQLRQTILQLAVQGQLVPQDPNDEPASVLLERARMECVDATDVGEAIDEAMKSTNASEDFQLQQPASWKVVRFADIISYGPRNGISPKPVERVTKTKSLTLSATTSGTFDGRHVKYLDQEFPSGSHLWLKDGDILIQRSNSEHYVGVAAIYRGNPNSFVYPDLMMKIRVASCIDIDFAHLILMSPASREYFRTRATGTSGSMRKINKTTVSALPFPLPPLAEQKRIVTKVTELLSLCDALEAKLTQAESASTQLLSAAVHQLLNGAVANV